MRFLVISYDNDPQQFYYDSIIADSAEAAVQKVLEVRDYSYHSEAIADDELIQMYGQLKYSQTDKQIEKRWRTIKRAHNK